jgi:two-component system, response regulator FlrC
MDQSTDGMHPHVLVVDDETLLHGVMERVLKRQNIRVSSCSSAMSAIELLAREPVDLVITDYKMPEMNGFALLAHIRQEHPAINVIMMTGHPNVQHAVQAMSEGAVDYLPKPFSTEALVERVQKHLSARRASVSKGAPVIPGRASSPKKTSSRVVDFVGEHPSIMQLKEFIPRIAASRATVFIHGESGAGKEVLARLVHLSSDRDSGPFVALNCANLPRELVESHLFGHRKGSFTGAIEDMSGAFEQADGGTLLLDEVTEIEISIQAKLLRVLQEQEFQRVGELTPRKVNVRIIATSNRDLKAAVLDGHFREDLYHRLAVFPLFIPPLRNRMSDVPLLAHRFVEKFCASYGVPTKEISADLLHRLVQYEWPGNVRELDNAIHRGVVMSGERSNIHVDDVLHPFFGGLAGEHTPGAPNGGIDFHKMTLEEVERHLILKTLDDTGQNQTEAAERLGICARTIRNKLKAYRDGGFLPASARGSAEA